MNRDKSPITKKILYLFILTGIAMRISELLSSRALSVMESKLALNLINFSFFEIFGELDHRQRPPTGFLIVQKLIVDVFGPSEWALRLFPFLCGILSIFLFYKLALKVLPRPAVCLAVGLFSFSDSLIFYSAYCRPYSNDVAFTLAITLIVSKILGKTPSISSWVSLTILGALFSWFSYCAPIILCSATIILAIHLLKDNRQHLSKLMIVNFLWGLNFIAAYQLFIRKIFSDDRFFKWIYGYFPLEVPLATQLQWLRNTISSFFEFPGGFHFIGLAILSFVIGLFSLFKNDKRKFYIISLPLFITIILTFTQLYRFSGRFVLFLTPMTYIFLALGAFQVYETFKEKSRSIGILFIFLLTFHPIGKSLKNFVTPRAHENIKPLLSVIENNYQKNDTFIIDKWTHLQIKYYADDLPIDGSSHMEIESMTPDSLIGQKEKITRLKFQRCWLIFRSDVPALSYWISVEYLSNHYRQLNSFRKNGYACYLFEKKNEN